MEDADDSESWCETALCYAELAAHQIARFKNPWWNPAWQDLVPGDPLPPPSRDCNVGWGLRRKRSRLGAQTGFAKRDAAAVAACSPATPLDFGSGSGASTSGGEDGSSWPVKRRCVFGGADISAAGDSCETKSVWNGRPPCAYRRSAAARDIRRQGKKKTLCELQEEEISLLEKRSTLQKEVEMGRVALETLKVENQGLKKSQQLHMRSEKVQIKDVTADPSSAAPNSRCCFLLPDLNEPLSENLS